MTFADCAPRGDTVLRIVLECTSPGRFALGDHPSEGPAAALICQGPDSGWYTEPNWWPHVEVGDYCGRAPEIPCDVCDPGGLVGYFEPNQTSFDLEIGQSTVDTLDVHATAECFTLPECGGGSVPCGYYSGLDTDVAWILLQPVGGDQRRMQRTVTAAGLEPGIYMARIWIVSVGCCGSSNCEEVSLTVRQPPRVEGTTWGLLRWKFRVPPSVAQPDSSTAR